MEKEDWKESKGGRLEILLETGLTYHYTREYFSLYFIHENFTEKEIEEAIEFVKERVDLQHTADTFNDILKMKREKILSGGN